jgi:multidrug efflux pump subunit AcrB
LLERLRQRPELADVASDLQEQGQQAYVQIDREAAGRLGVTVAAIDTALYNAFGQRLVSTIYTQTSQYRVVLEAAPGLGRGLTAIAALYVPGTTTNASGTTTQVQIPLSSVAQVLERPAALAINHVAQFPAATVSFNLAPGASLGDAVEAIKAEEASLRPAAQRRNQLPGRGGGIPRLVEQYAAADPGGGGHDVHRAWCALRELHPPDHHPVHAAVGGPRAPCWRCCSQGKTWAWSASSASCC